jgi:predicted porin
MEAVQLETDLMKKTVLCAAALSALAGSAWAQSSVTVYGIVDAAVRSSDSGAKGTTNNEVFPGGMSQSRLGFRGTEDLGGGMAGMFNMEHRFLSDVGTPAAADFWRQAWVGLKTNYGAVYLGRQYNVLFDVTTSTYASFKYSPYIEAFKPEIGMALGARTSNTVKYVFELGGLRAGLAASAGENAASGGASRGGYVRYETGPFAAGAGIESLKDGKGNKVTSTTFGGAYTWDKLVLVAGWAKTDPDALFDRATLAALLSNGGTNGGFGVSTHLDKRTMVSFGALYQLTPQLNLGAHYWKVKQDSLAGFTDGDGTAKFAAAVADYALSKRTDVYVEADRTALGKKLVFANGETSRTGYMVGVRHRF